MPPSGVCVCVYVILTLTTTHLCLFAEGWCSRHSHAQKDEPLEFEVLVPPVSCQFPVPLHWRAEPIAARLQQRLCFPVLRRWGVVEVRVVLSRDPGHVDGGFRVL